VNIYPLLFRFKPASAGPGIRLPSIAIFKCNAGSLSNLCHRYATHVCERL